VPETISLDGHSLTRMQVVAISRGASVTIAPEASERVQKAAAFIDEQVRQGAVIYGVSTGFGRNADRVIDPAQAEPGLPRDPRNTL